MKFLLIYGVLFLLLWTKGSAIDREESLTDYTVEEGIVNESVLVEVSSSDLKNNHIPYFLILKALNPVTQIDLSAGSDQSWNILSYKILHGAQKIRVPMRLQMWYASEWMRMLSVWHDKSFLLYFLGKLII